ncbi:MAG: diaminopimelate epimerase [Gemmatimonadota bacterium]|nr:diaminopimelate epimerase [Gemmatimonadota bacterium]
MLSKRFYKAHGLGNDYLVFEEGSEWIATPDTVAEICDRNHGVGADGIVVLMGELLEGLPQLRMFNPDGSEFERSGNGLRILAAYLYREDRVGDTPFEGTVGGDLVRMTVHDVQDGIYDISVEMGQARVGPDSVGLNASSLDSSGRILGTDGSYLNVIPVSIGNPHLVVFVPEVSNTILESLGPFLATHSGLSNGANVQLVGPLVGNRLEAAIWERGVGPTSASGTSACAVAVAAIWSKKLDPGAVMIDTTGGSLEVHVNAELEVVLHGPVTEVCTGTLI